MTEPHKTTAVRNIIRQIRNYWYFGEGIGQKFNRTGRIFISYRRSDNAAFTYRLYDFLEKYYGSSDIILDIDSLKSIKNPRVYIEQAINKCRIFLLVYGDRWEGEVADNSAPSRLFIDDDWVRAEVEWAISKGIYIRPISIGETALLSARLLPNSIKDIQSFNVTKIDIEQRFNSDVKRLIVVIDEILYGKSIIAHLSRILLGLRRNLLAFLSVILFGTIIFLLLRVPPFEKINEMVSNYDPYIFSHSQEGAYEISRSIPGRESLERNTKIADMMTGTLKTFDFFAERGGVFIQWQDQVRAMVRNGVHVRIVLIDNSSDRSENLKSKLTESVAGARQRNRDFAIRDFSSVFQNLQSLKEEIDNNTQTYPGKFEIKYLDRIYLNSLWVRDSTILESAVAHIQFSVYGNDRNSPVIRFGRLSPQSILIIQQEFDFIWKEACVLPLSSEPCPDRPQFSN